MEIVIPQHEIQKRVEELALEISADHRKSKNALPPVMICILNGSYMFYTDLLRYMNIDVQSDFIRIKSYEGQDNSGGCKIIKDLEVDLKGRNVYIVDDICDTGATIIEAISMANEHIPNDVKVVTLARRGGAKNLTNFCGFILGEEWIVGYGLDDNGIRRNLEDIYKIN